MHHAKQRAPVGVYVRISFYTNFFISLTRRCAFHGDQTAATVAAAPPPLREAQTVEF